MRTSSVASLTCTTGLAFLLLVSPGLGEAAPGFEPLALPPYNAALVQSGSCSDEMFIRVTGAIKGPGRRNACVSSDQHAGLSIQMFNEAPVQIANELESVKPVFQRPIPAIPGKTLSAVVVSYPPGGKSPPHRHAKSAFIYAFVLSGAIRTGLGFERPVVYQAGDSFYEEPGAHHTISENASETNPASFLAVFILDNEDHPLTLPDPDPSAERR